MPETQLSDRAVISISGSDAEHFLQNIITTDLDGLKVGEAKPGALLTPQGKILFDFLVSRSGDGGFLLDCRSDVTTDFVKRLTLYKLRAKAEIAVHDQLLVLASWQSESGSSRIDSTALVDLRFPPEAGVTRRYATGRSGDASPEDWHRLRIAHGVAESGKDYPLGDAFPHDVLLDETGGVGFRKGCYVGQEVVSRMQHRGTARRRVMIARGKSDLPANGTEITVNDRPVGRLGTASGQDGLAIVRIDRVKDALDAGEPILAQGVPITLSIPSWAKYTLPQQADAPNSA